MFYLQVLEPSLFQGHVAELLDALGKRICEHIAVAWFVGAGDYYGDLHNFNVIREMILRKTTNTRIIRIVVLFVFVVFLVLFDFKNPLYVTKELVHSN